MTDKSELEEELRSHRESYDKSLDYWDELEKEYDTIQSEESFSPSNHFRLPVLNVQMASSVKRIWEHRVRIQEIVAALAQIELKEQSHEVLEEIKGYTKATKDAIEQGKKQTTLMTWCTGAITVMTAAITIATIALIYLQQSSNPTPPVETRMYGEN